jgi:hypothetical protein
MVGFGLVIGSILSDKSIKILRLILLESTADGQFVHGIGGCSLQQETKEIMNNK